jgi:peptidoglycan-associated lipoprotein
VSPPPAPQLPPSAPLTEEELFAKTSLADLNAQEPLDDAFFAYDRAELSDPARTALERDATWMRKWTRTRVVVEGHADERGTNEYNLALGEKRAAVTRDYLVGLGIEQSRISILSKGEEAPFCTGQNEACWRQNRRGHFIITAK